MAKFRYSLNAGVSWTTIDAALPFSIPSTAGQDVIVEPIGASVLNEKLKVLSALTVSSNKGSIGQSFSATITGKTDGSTITLSGSGAAGLSVDGATISGTPTAAGAVNLIETLAGASNSPRTTSGLIDIASAPFSYDTNTYFWDFNANDNEIDTLGSPTVSRVRERIGNKATLRNYNKAWQPVKVAGGISFNQSTNRVLNFSLPPTITNGKNGWYLAFTFTPTTASNGVIMSISSAGSTVNSRMYVDFTGSRNIRLRFGANDSGTLATLFTSVALTLGQKYAVEILFDFDTDTYTLWINGVNQNVAVTGAPWANFPASNPKEVLIGNITSGNLSLDAVLNNIVFQDGVPSAEIRSSIGAFQQTRQAA